MGGPAIAALVQHTAGITCCLPASPCTLVCGAMLRARLMLEGLTCAQLKAGNTIFVRYASRVFFSDLATEAIKVEDLK